MYVGCPVELQMERVFSSDGIFDEGAYHCTIVSYNDENILVLELHNEDLAILSLDAKYRCYIKAKKELLLCSGVIKERYQRQGDNMVVFKIENGFYDQSVTFC
jgi:hypothetical protein